jgi:hypothetical protein
VFLPPKPFERFKRVESNGTRGLLHRRFEILIQGIEHLVHGLIPDGPREPAEPVVDGGHVVNVILVRLVELFLCGPVYEGLDTVSPAVIRLLTAVLPPGDSSSK